MRRPDRLGPLRAPVHLRARYRRAPQVVATSTAPGRDCGQATATWRRPRIGRLGMSRVAEGRASNGLGRCRCGTEHSLARRARRRLPTGSWSEARRYRSPVLRFLTAGESHGRALVVIVEGLPAGLPIAVEQVQSELARRRLGYGRGPRMRFEQDEVTIIGGVRHGRTLGSPVAIEIGNTEWDRDPDKWQKEMSVRAEDGPTQAPLTEVRPGHADLAGMQKYGFTDARDVLERASARETAARVAAGVGGQGAARRARRRHREPRHPDGRGSLEGGHPSRPRRPGPGRRVRRCGASTPPPRRRWSPRSRRPPRTATASAASSRCSPTACRSGWAATCTGTASSTRCWPGRSCRSRP